MLLTSSEAVLSALPSPLLAEAQMLRDRAMSHYQARSLFGGGHRLSNRRNGLGFERQTVMDRGVGVTIGRRASSVADCLKLKEVEGEPLLDRNALKALIRLLRLAQVSSLFLMLNVGLRSTFDMYNFRNQFKLFVSFYLIRESGCMPKLLIK